MISAGTVQVPLDVVLPKNRHDNTTSSHNCSHHGLTDPISPCGSSFDLSGWGSGASGVAVAGNSGGGHDCVGGNQFVVVPATTP